jgi:type II secretory ATPase GspE/PulE/Tfp pilus assembly ATPase PilB-like protein
MVTAQEALPAAISSRLSDTQRQAILEAPRGARLGALVSALGVDENTALAELAAAAGLDIATNLETDPGARGLLPARLVHDFQIIPIRFAAQGDGEPEEPTPATPLHIASAWVPDASMADWLRTFTPRPLAWHMAVPERVHQLIIENFGVGSGALEDSDEGYVAPEAMRDADADVDEDAAVVRFVTDVITQAVNDEATDIHFEPQEDQLRIRYRVDGLLVPVSVPENLLRFQDAIISRVKIMARLNISEKRLPQDGRINFNSAGNTLDIRVSTIPTIYAESISLRLLNKKKEAYTMDRLGMSAGEQAQIKQVLDYPHGIILVTGPTGSGKSTSLNAFLRQINSTDLRIITVEDPIEYEVPGVNQMQVRSEIGLTFASALRHILRQDPDVIMVGEIRDRETADIAIRAALTGHLVFSTLHTNDAPSAITRLADMGVENYLITSSLVAVLAQRLVRVICPGCKTRAGTALSPDGVMVDTFRGAGCAECGGRGYASRMGIFEMMELNDEIRKLIMNNEDAGVLTKAARRNGMRNLREDGWMKISTGVTTVAEVLRVTQEF